MNLGYILYRTGEDSYPQSSMHDLPNIFATTVGEQQATDDHV